MKYVAEETACEYCGKIIVQIRKNNRKYCNDRCSNAMQTLRKKEKRKQKW